MASKKQMTHAQALDLVYATIARLRSSGRRDISVSKVAIASGVGRSTINNKNDLDWIEVRDVILNNTPSPRVKLAKAELKEQTKWQLEAIRLNSELDFCKTELDRLIDKTHGEFVKLYDQLHEYSHLARSAKKKMNANAKDIKEITELKSKLESLEAENRILKANLAPSTTVVPFVRKKVINVYPEDQRANLSTLDLGDLVSDAMYELDHYFGNPHSPKAVYVLCGNFASGKSTWISEHKPPFQESTTVVYFDGTNHTTVMRKWIMKHIRNLNKKHNVDCKIVCVRVFCDLNQCLERNSDIGRTRHKNTITEDLIKTFDKNFQQVDLKEGFDEIIIVGGV